MRDYENYPSLPEMRALGLWRLDWRALLTVKTGELPAAEVEALDAYFRQFTPMPDGCCIRCGTAQGGLMGALLGGFQYGLAHGEGHCGKCRWPGRANHYDIGTTIKSFPIILQYHPDELVDQRKTAVNE